MLKEGALWDCWSSRAWPRKRLRAHLLHLHNLGCRLGEGPKIMISVSTKNGHSERYQRLAPAHSRWRGWSVRGEMGYLWPFLERALVDIATRILIAMCKLKQIINLFGGGVSWGAERLLFTTRRVAVIVDIFGFSLRWWVAELGQGCMSCYGLKFWEKKLIEVDSLHSLGRKFIHPYIPS